MTEKKSETSPASINAAHFDIASLDDEIRVDHLCCEILQRFVAALQENGVEPLAAGRLARGADYFIRDFLVADRHTNPLHPEPERVRQFGGNWYIITTLEPNLTELADTLAGVTAFYRFLADKKLLEVDNAEAIATACTELAFFKERIEAFWDIEGDGFAAWDAGCPVT
ncbi:MAG: hypothetical protein C0616_08215 [Desulfuromonas sp.]|nr:MAG: hypothetical protein C0616_08215 [Desulfuromonas sp.]